MTDFEEQDFLRFYRETVQRDAEKMQLPPGSLFVEHALQNYCSSLEFQLFNMQQKLYDLQQQTEAEKSTKDALRGEIAALRNEVAALDWQVKYDKALLREIRTSRSWILVRMLHYLYGFFTGKKEIMREFKNDLDDLLAQAGASDSAGRSRTALFFRYLLNGAAGAVKKLPLAEPERKTEHFEIFCEENTYGSFYQEDELFKQFPSDLKTVAFYLPQFHTFPENDEWWGKGFTEWSNTKKAKQRFPGHYQPRTPHQDIGFYDLSDIETMKKQAALAKAHGIDCFCFYYYWFDGKKLMEKPLEQLIAHPEIKMNFCLCWANENWTRTWDGQQKSVLIQQNYSKANDLKFIQDLKKYLTDPRYMRCNGKPVILVYHAKIMPDADRTFALWRKWCRQNGVGEIQIWCCRTFIKNNEFKRLVEADREVEFPPHLVSDLEMFPASKFQAYQDDGFYYNYQKIIHDVQNNTTMADRAPYPFYRCAMLGWDNSCRRASGYSVWQYFNLSSYHLWLRKNIEYTRKYFLEKERFLFINAWNEWAEGTYLEPDERYGYASINTTSRALCDLPALPDYTVLQPDSNFMEQPGKILIHLHLFYPDLTEEFSCYLSRMPFVYDCILTTDSREKENQIRSVLKTHPLENCNRLNILVLPNCGRDVAPFFASCRKQIQHYDYIGHFHTKKSLTVSWGEEWRHYLLDQLLGKEEYIRAIFRRFERDASLGLFFPAPYPPMSNYMNWENNRARCEELLKKMNMHVALPEYPFFPTGQMFWAKTKAIQAVFAPGTVKQEDFEAEKNQITGTLAHAIERLWKYIAQGSHYNTLAGVFPPVHPPKEVKKVRRLALYVHYSADGKISEADKYLLRELHQSAEIIFINNGPLNRESRHKLSAMLDKRFFRANSGYDFAAWRDALAKCDLKDYDELVLLNNSIAGPFCAFDEIFGKMADKPADFWGMTEFPETVNPRREEAKLLPGGLIPRHIQSYFMVFKRQVFLSDAFRSFWNDVEDETSLPAVVAHCETQLSNVLEQAGFRSGVYLHSAARMQEFDTVTPEYNALYCRPQDFLVLGFPFLKKNICCYLTQPEINETIHLISQLCNYPVENIKITKKTR